MNNTYTNTEEKHKSCNEGISNSISIEYIAGFFDGEGCIYINNKTHRLRVCITNTNYYILKQFKEMFGGSIYKRQLRKLKNNRGYCKQIFQWSIEFNNALRFLECIQPYTIVKKEQIELAIKYRNRINPSNGGKPLSNEEKYIRESYIKQIKKLIHVNITESKLEHIYKKVSNSINNRYIAGFFDAEGTVCIHKNTDGVSVGIKQTHYEVLRLIQEIFNGKISTIEEKYCKDGCHRKRTWTWEIHSNNAIKFLTVISPFLFEKQEQIILAIKYYTQIIKMNQRKTRTICERETREKYKIQMINLKKRINNDFSNMSTISISTNTELNVYKQT